MVWTNVNNMSTSEFCGTIGTEDLSIGSNTGTPIELASVTKAETGSNSWAGLDPNVSVANNSHSIAQLAVASLQSTYPDKEVDLVGIYIEETEV